MTNRGQMRFVLLCGVAAVTLAGIGQPARAEEGAIVKNLLGTMGIIPRQKEEIRYRERAPLVVPPKTELRTPSANAAATNPNWPTDPEVAAARRAAEAARVPRTQTETYRSFESNTRLSPAELQAGRVAKSTPTDQADHVPDRAGMLLRPWELWTGTKQDDSKTAAAAAAEPKRRSLTEPPDGFRRQANKNPGQEFAPRVDQQARDSPMSWLTGKFSGSSEDD